MTYGSLKNESSGIPDDELLKEDVARLWCARRSNTLFLLYLPMYICYIAGGALIFMQTEGTLEQEYRTRLREKRAEFLEDNACISDETLESFIGEVVRASQQGVLASKNVTSGSNWSFGQSFFFSSTIVTTIGYGNVHPLSEGGKSFCIAYAMLGIPMTFVLLSALVERLMVPARYSMMVLISKLGHLYQSFTLRVAHLAIVCFTCFILFFVFPALVFASIESGWGFSDAFYYCFISLTTIGLGDYIPGDSPDQYLRPLYKICITCYLILGLTTVMLMLRLYRDIPQLNLGLLLLPSSDLNDSFSFSLQEHLQPRGLSTLSMSQRVNQDDPMEQTDATTDHEENDENSIEIP